MVPASASSPRAELPVPSAVAPSAASAPAEKSADTPPSPPHTGPLATFHNALRAIDRGERKEHVRIAWLGDSHAQADFWTDTVRRGLQRRFGLGGPGFVHLGFKSYRHGGIKTDIKGRWRMRPKQPSTSEPWGDGAFGMGGILHAGYAEYRAAAVQVTDHRLENRALRWDLCYKFGTDGDAFRLAVYSPAAVPPDAGVGDEFAVSGDIGKLQHVARTTTGPATLRVKIEDGRPDFCGLVIETDPTDNGPGVVLDNLGINGARYGTALAWNELAWADEVKRRPPEMFVLEYGGNEASDRVQKPQQYGKDLLELIARVRRIRADASCLVVGVADRADREAVIPAIVDAQREAAAEAGCMFWDTYAIMGGKGSLRAWRDQNKAAPDGVHLKPSGYEELGALLLEALMRDYRR